MANIANITVFDGAATPVSHTLIPVSISAVSGAIVALWRESLPGLPVESQIRYSQTMRVLKSGVVEIRCRVDVPVMEATNGGNVAGYTAAPKVAYVDSDEWVKRSHPRSAVTGRRLSKQLLTNISNNVSVTVPAAVTGVFDDAVSGLFMPT